MRKALDMLLVMALSLVCLMSGVLLGQWGAAVSGRLDSAEARMNSLETRQGRADAALFGEIAAGK